MSDDRINVGWFLAGLGLGSVAAILFAPKSGRETRKAIATRVGDTREYLASVGKNASEQAVARAESEKGPGARRKEQTDAAATEHPAVPDGAAARLS
jgi:gas vesicle protein